jgi:hypothetical protein
MKQSMVHGFSNFLLAALAFMGVALTVGCAASPEDIKPNTLVTCNIEAGHASNFRRNDSAL